MNTFIQLYYMTAKVCETNSNTTFYLRLNNVYSPVNLRLMIQHTSAEKLQIKEVLYFARVACHMFCSY